MSTLPNALICSSVSLWRKIAEVGDAERAEIENKSRALERVAELLLVNRHAVNQNVAHCRADLVPFRAVVAQSAQDDRLALGDFDVVVIGMFASDGDRVRRDVRRRIKARRDRIGDDLACPLLEVI